MQTDAAPLAHEAAAPAPAPAPAPEFATRKEVADLLKRVDQIEMAVMMRLNAVEARMLPLPVSPKVEGL